MIACPGKTRNRVKHWSWDLKDRSLTSSAEGSTLQEEGAVLVEVRQFRKVHTRARSPGRPRGMDVQLCRTEVLALIYRLPSCLPLCHRGFQVLRRDSTGQFGVGPPQEKRRLWLCLYRAGKATSLPQAQVPELSVTTGTLGSHPPDPREEEKKVLFLRMIPTGRLDLGGLGKAPSNEQ